ncbi:uncharacterized protein LOC131664084 [Phymastichus coffea]|nr:uncharacterized protein LOC131664084 [Phymastichus coffea]
MTEQENKDFSEDVAEQNFEQNGEAENGDQENAGAGGGDATENGQESQEDRSAKELQDTLNDRKLFVGGLSWETTEKELRNHFSQFGDIESINVKTDPFTGRSRGFAFIVFSKVESLDKAMAHGDHIINNKKVDPKKAKAKARHGKIFVGGLSTELSDDDIKNFFIQFGTIIDVEMPFDKTKNQRKGFCFITFESEQVANDLLKTSKQTINGKDVEVKKATPRPEMGGMRGMGRGGRGARGGRGRGFGSQGGWGQGGYGGGYGQGGYGGGYGGGYDGYGGNYDYYGGGYGGYGGYDYSGYDGYGYGGGSYDGGYSGGRGGARGKGGSGFGGKQRGGGRQNQRHQPLAAPSHVSVQARTCARQPSCSHQQQQQQQQQQHKQPGKARSARAAHRDEDGRSDSDSISPVRCSGSPRPEQKGTEESRIDHREGRASMDSPNMYDAQAHQVGQQQLQAELKKSSQLLGQQNNNNNNSNNNNNNNNNNNSSLQVNHNQALNGVSKVSASKASVHQQYAEHCAVAGELIDLNNPEMTVDLQQMIDDSHFNDGLLDMLGAASNGIVAAGLKHAAAARLPLVGAGANGQSPYARQAAAALAYMPQPVHSAAAAAGSYHHAASSHNSCSDSNSSSSESPSIKEEPIDPSDYRRHCQQYAPAPAYAPAAGPFAAGAQQQQQQPPQQQPTFTTLTPSGLGHALHAQPAPQAHPQPPHQQPRAPGALKQAGLLGPQAAAAGRKQSKSVDKASDEYRRRRERNNIAVRKSREKAKVRSRETEERVKHLVKENDVLRKKVEILTEELNVLRSLFSSVGVLPEPLQREISRHIDQFQQHVQPM